MTTTPRRVAIVGGGLAGTLTAIQLLRQTRHPLEIVLIERRFPIGPGRAFATSLPCHLLNVPALRMSLFPDDAEHLLRWLGSTPPYSFVPRQTYAAYVESTLSAAEQESVATLTRLPGEAVGIDAPGIRVRLREGDPVAADHVVLAIGNPPPLDPVSGGRIERSPRYSPDPWDEGALRDLDPNDSVVTIGSNLTMVDVALALDQARHRGPILAISRHGLVPHRHGDGFPQPWDWSRNGTPRGPRRLLRDLRTQVVAAERAGLDWRSVVDALRPRIGSIWSAWSEAERRRFLRHARPFWEIHRHRMAPENAATIDELFRSGRLRVVAGRITEARDVGDAIEMRLERRGGGRDTLRAARVVNCTGPGMDFARSRDPLTKDLVASGQARPGPLGLGFDADRDGALLDRAGAPSPTLSTLGPPLKGLLWETTAVPEIRVQAQALAGRILKGIR